MPASSLENNHIAVVSNGSSSPVGAKHPNGRPVVRGLVRPTSERMADYERLFGTPAQGETSYLEQILHSLLIKYLIKQEHRMGWAHRSACDDTSLQSHPNETVASHQWGVAMLVRTLSLTPQFQEELPNFDCLKAIEMALIHDVPEAKVGDITPRDGISPDMKHKLEREAIDEMLSFYPEPVRTTMHMIYNSYEDRQCDESKFVKDCDKLDFILTAFLLERQGFQDVCEFYENTLKEGFWTTIAKDLAETIIKKRNELQDKKMLFRM